MHENVESFLREFLFEYINIVIRNLEQIGTCGPMVSALDCQIKSKLTSYSYQARRLTTNQEIHGSIPCTFRFLVSWLFF